MKNGTRVRVTKFDEAPGLVGELGTVVYPQVNMMGFDERVKLDSGTTFLFHAGEVEEVES